MGKGAVEKENMLKKTFDEIAVQRVWEKGTIVPSLNPSSFRKDRCGAIIQRFQHGIRDSKYGWEIHHIIPESHGGSDNLDNLIPLQWENNAETSDSTTLKCKVRS